MTRLSLEGDDSVWTARPDRFFDLSIPLDFAGPQPAHFGADPARARPMIAGSFTGDTTQAGSCNAAVVTVNVHCNGTHTETVAHLTDTLLAPREIAPGLTRAVLVSIEPERAADSSESTVPAPHRGDRLLTRHALDACASRWLDDDVDALIVRTLPNEGEKKHRKYLDAAEVPYFTAEAMRFLVGAGIDHLLVDTPSVDRLHDEGALTGHRIFWGLPPGSREIGDAARGSATITEMIFVPDDADDGRYLLDLQVAPFLSDAAPSRPLVYPVTRP